MSGTFKVGRMNEEAKKASSNQKHDFSEYMWMADLESFDREVRSEIEEEDYIRSSIEQLLVEEERATVYYNSDGNIYPPESNGQVYNEYGGQYNQGEGIYESDAMQHQMGNLDIGEFSQNYYENGSQQMLGPYLQPNGMMRHQFHEYIPHNTYIPPYNGQQNVYYQNETTKYNQTQNNVPRDMRNPIRPVSN